jgi:hypothetical protein
MGLGLGVEMLMLIDSGLWRLSKRRRKAGKCPLEWKVGGNWGNVIWLLKNQKKGKKKRKGKE